MRMRKQAISLIFLFLFYLSINPLNLTIQAEESVVDENTGESPEEPVDPTVPSDPIDDPKDEEPPPSDSSPGDGGEEQPPKNEEKPVDEPKDTNTGGKDGSSKTPTKKPSKKPTENTSSDKGTDTDQRERVQPENDDSLSEDDMTESEEVKEEEDFTIESIKESGGSIVIKNGKLYVVIDGEYQELSKEKIKELGLEELLKKNEKVDQEIVVETIEQEEEVADSRQEQAKEEPIKKEIKRNYALPIGIISLSLIGAAIFGYRYFK